MYFYDESNTNFIENKDNAHYENPLNELYQSTNDDTVEPQESPIDFLNNNNLELDGNHHLFSESCLFDSPGRSNWDAYQQQQQILDTQQEAILLSDPNFLRQHQLLRDQHYQQQQQGDEVSNLTAMFEPMKQETPVKKKANNRRQHDNNLDASDETKIDHQRRFNELQARFRVNYAPKPSSQSKGKSTKKFSTSPQPQNIITKRASVSNRSTVAHFSSPSCKEDDASFAPIKLEHVPSRIQDQQTPSAVGGLVTHTATTTTTTTTTTTSMEDGYPSSSKESPPVRTLPIQIQRVSRPNSNQPYDAESHQRQLDNQLTKVDFDDITVSELKEMLRQRGKPATGKKAILLQRLQEERDIAKGGRSPSGNHHHHHRSSSSSSNSNSHSIANHRHSQPLPLSRSLNVPETSSKQQRPRSFQGGGGGSSPITIHKINGANALPSMPSVVSPGSPGGQLHRSIANMHIGSPPATCSRRYSPYSPRLSHNSPKTAQHEYSSSLPLYSGDLSSSPNHNDANMQTTTNTGNGMMMLSSSYSARPAAATSRYFNNPKASYKPFTSSTLATPDREEDVNPFDSYYDAGGKSPIITKEKKTSEPPPDMHYNHALDSNNSVMSMDWSDPNALELLLQQGTYNMNIAEMIGQPLYSDDVVLTNEQIMALLNTQQADPPFEFRLNDTNFTPDQPLFQQQQQQQQQQQHYHS